MRARWMIAVLILVLLFGGALPASAQGTVNLSIDELQINPYPEAQVMVTVRDVNGVPIVGLGADDFEIIEDGREAFPPTEATMHVNPDAAISLMMVIDISGSMKGKPIEEAMRAANALLDQLSTQDRAGIIAFADQVKSLDPNVLEEGKELGFTADKNAVRNVVNFLESKIGWDTPLYDAIYKGVKMSISEPAGKRALVVMTDGRDERDNAAGVPVKDAGSVSTPDDPINEANRYNLPIFSIGLIGLGGKIDTKYLTRLAERTGGIYQQAPQPEELTPLFQNVVNQLKTQYVLNYETRLQQDNQVHSVMVRANLPQGQDFDDTKFQFAAAPPAPPDAPPTEVLAAVSPSPESQGSSAAVGSSEETVSPPTDPTPEPTSEGIEGIIDTVTENIEDRPLLAVGIGVGALLLIILLVSLLVVLLRGRKRSAEEPAAVEFEEAYAPAPPAWSPEPVDSARPAPAPMVEGDKTEATPIGWQQPAMGMPPFAPVTPGVQAEVPPEGGTVIIERAPKHLAMLVDKSRPDRRYDLKGTINVGRSRENQIVLDDPTVSRNHAWIKLQGEDFLVFDVGSGNGTFVNEERVEAPRRLENGDVVRFGDAAFVFTKVF
jgi:VWFA-related protein